MTVSEAALYAPVKALLESRGYTVKAEIGPVDVMAVRDGEPPLVVELKTGFSLALLHQAVDRLAITDHVYVAVPKRSGRAAFKAMRANVKLCRRLGIGVLAVRLPDGFVETLCDPVPYAPRKSNPRSVRLLREFANRAGDPNTGGVNRRTITTAYRQDAMTIVDFLRENGPTKASDIAKATGIERARTILAANHYGWFQRVAHGVYGLSETK